VTNDTLNHVYQIHVSGQIGRFLEICVCTQALGFGPVRFLARGGDNDNGDAMASIPTAEFPQNVNSSDPRYVQIQKHQYRARGLLFSHLFPVEESVLAISGDMEPKIQLATVHDSLNDERIRRVVFYEQYDAGCRLPGFSAVLLLSPMRIARGWQSRRSILGQEQTARARYARHIAPRCAGKLPIRCRFRGICRDCVAV
jgi:hypothetical protein